MTVARLVSREIRHRKLNFALGLGSVTVAVACLVGVLTSLRGYDRATEKIIAAKQADTEKRMAALEEQTKTKMAQLEDEMRKIVKGLGFNIYIFPEGQDMSEVYSEGYASKTMPEEYVHRLANSRIMTINHLLPSLTQKITWSEQKRTILLTGVRGEAALMHRDPKKPILEVVPHGKAVLGYELHQSLGLKPGSAFRLMGKRFIVDKCHEARGTVDDITIWINLDEAQAMLNKPGQINSILALECNCFSIDRLGDVRREVAAILPHTKVIEQGSKALARAEARQAAKKAAQQQLEQARATAAKELAAARQARQELRQKREAFAALLAPLVIVLCAVWVAALTFANVRERVNEIGILRALGVRASTVLSVFLLKASAMGLAGAFVGCAVAIAASEVLRQKLFSGYSAVVVLSPVEWLGAICLAPLLACLAAWPPAVLAAQQDPASVLREE